MPFTVVHPAAVLPLVRGPLVPSALVAGALAPDLPYYVSLQWIGGDYNLTLTHEPTSVLWLDPLIALVLLAGFHLLLKWPLVALLPRAAAGRAAPAAQGFTWGGAAPAWIALSVLAGAATHLAWDALGDVLGYAWSSRLNGLGSALGAAVLLGWFVRWWRRTSPRPVAQGTVLPRRARVAVVGTLLALAAVGGGVAVARALPDVQQSHREQGTWSVAAVGQDAARIAAVDAGTAVLLGVAGYAVGWQAARLVPRRPQSAPPVG